MSVRVMSWVWDHSRSKKTERLVLLAIADCASDDGANAYPSMAEIRRKTGLSERGAQSAIASLVKLGELFVGLNRGPRGCNRYRVIMSTPADGAPPQEMHPADPAGVRKGEGRQRKAQDPADGAPPAESAPPQGMHPTPADPAPGTVLEPSENSSSKSSSKTVGRTRGTRLPDNFQATAEMIAWARQDTPHVGAKETDAFVDYWRAQPGQKGVKTDWPATWRNWMRRAQTDFERRAGRPAGRANHQAFTNPADEDAYGGTL